MKFLVLFFLCGASGLKLKEKYSWKELSFAWPSDDAKQEAVSSGKYIEKNNFPMSFDVWKEKLFVAVPRLKTGVASSLNSFKMTDDKSPILQPYPSWEANEIPPEPSTTAENDELKIVSAVRIRVDECDRLWVIDSGTDEILGSSTQLLPTSILIFDLSNDKFIRRFVIPSEQKNNKDSFFANIIVDVLSAKCGDAFAYIADVITNSVIVYDYKNDRSHRVRHHFFHFEPLQGNFSVSGVSFQSSEGIMGMALGKLKDNGERTIYFSSLASTKQFSVPNLVLKNESFSTSNRSFNSFTLLGDRGPKSQSTAVLFDDKTTSIFYTQISRDGIGCWSIHKPFTPENQGLIDTDPEALVYPSDLKMKDGQLFVLSNRLPLFYYGSLKAEFNYRILFGKTEELIVGTICSNATAAIPATMPGAPLTQPGVQPTQPGAPTPQPGFPPATAPPGVITFAPVAGPTLVTNSNKQVVFSPLNKT